MERPAGMLRLGLGQAWAWCNPGQFAPAPIHCKQAQSTARPGTMTSHGAGTRAASLASSKRPPPARSHRRTTLSEFVILTKKPFRDGPRSRGQIRVLVAWPQRSDAGPRRRVAPVPICALLPLGRHFDIKWDLVGPSCGSHHMNE